MDRDGGIVVKINQMKKVVRIQISIPNEGHTQPESYDNRLLMCFHLGMLQIASKHGIKEYDGIGFNIPDDIEFQFNWSTVGRVLTPLARERLTEWALKSEVNYMLMIDDDQICPVDMFEKLYKHNVDVVAALAFMRIAPHYPVIYKTEEGYDPLSHLEYFTTQNVRNYPKNKLVECDAVGFGAVLIKMDVIKKMKNPWFMSTTQSGEDIWFCHKAKKEAGAKIFMDTSVKLGHLGLPPVIEEKDYDREFEVDKYRKVYGDWNGVEKKDRMLVRNMQ